jgi:hypothetical protein
MINGKTIVTRESLFYLSFILKPKALPFEEYSENQKEYNIYKKYLP